MQKQRAQVSAILPCAATLAASEAKAWPVTVQPTCCCLLSLSCSRLQVKGVPDAGAASLRVSGLELGGLFGSLLAGKLSGE